MPTTNINIPRLITISALAGAIVATIALFLVIPNMCSWSPSQITKAKEWQKEHSAHYDPFYWLEFTDESYIEELDGIGMSIDMEAALREIGMVARTIHFEDSGMAILAIEPQDDIGPLNVIIKLRLDGYSDTDHVSTCEYMEYVWPTGNNWRQNMPGFVDSFYATCSKPILIRVGENHRILATDAIVYTLTGVIDDLMLCDVDEITRFWPALFKAPAPYNPNSGDMIDSTSVVAMPPAIRKERITL